MTKIEVSNKTVKNNKLTVTNFLSLNNYSQNWNETGENFKASDLC